MATTGTTVPADPNDGQGQGETQNPATSEHRVKEVFDPTTMPGAIMAATIGGLIVALLLALIALL
jgi:hypothetical protein